MAKYIANISFIKYTTRIVHCEGRTIREAKDDALNKADAICELEGYHDSKVEEIVKEGK